MRRCPIDEAQWLASSDPAKMLAFANSGDVLVDNSRGRAGLDSVYLKVSPRRLRLFAAACCRACWGLLTDERSRRAVEVAERYADGLATEGEREAADYDATTVSSGGPYSVATSAAMWACEVRPCASGDPYHWQISRTLGDVGVVPFAAQADLLREIVPNPFRPVVLPWGPCRHCGEPMAKRSDGPHVAGPCPWLTPTVVSLAQAAYSERLPERECGPCGGTGAHPHDLYVGARPARKCPDCGGSGRVGGGRLDPARLMVLADALLDAGCDESSVLAHLRGAGPHARGCWAVDLILGKS